MRAPAQSGLPAPADLAMRLLGELGDRWTHVQAVAARAEELTETVPPGDRELLVDAAWLHDIGYAPDLALTGLHALDGARHLTQMGYPARLCSLVAHHSGARFEAEFVGLTGALEVYPLEESPTMDALVVADLTTGPQGQRFSYEERMDEILSRYGPDSVVHQAIRRMRVLLGPQVERVAQRQSSRLKRIDLADDRR